MDTNSKFNSQMPQSQSLVPGYLGPGYLPIENQNSQNYSIPLQGYMIPSQNQIYQNRNNYIQNNIQTKSEENTNLIEDNYNENS